MGGPVLGLLFLDEMRAHHKGGARIREAPPAQHGTSPVQRGNLVTAGGAVTDLYLMAVPIKHGGVGFGRRPLF
jgi:hypothetical protein